MTQPTGPHATGLGLADQQAVKMLTTQFPPARRRKVQSVPEPGIGRKTLSLSPQQGRPLRLVVLEARARLGGLGWHSSQPEGVMRVARVAMCPRALMIFFLWCVVAFSNYVFMEFGVF